MSTFRENCLIHDVLGVGFGPSNLAFAIAHEEADSQLDVRSWSRQTVRTGNPECCSTDRTSRTIHCATRDASQPEESLTPSSTISSRRDDSTIISIWASCIHSGRIMLSTSLWAAQFFSERVTLGTRVSSVEYDRDLHCWTARSDKDRFLARSLLVGLVGAGMFRKCSRLISEVACSTSATTVQR